MKEETYFMMKLSRVKTKVIIINLSILFLLLTFTTSGKINSVYRNVYLIMFLIILILKNLRYTKFKFTYYDILWIIFSFTIFISDIYNNNKYGEGILFLIYIIIYFKFIPKYIKHIDIIGYALILHGLFILISSLIFSPIQIEGYAGIMGNANGLGMNLMFLNLGICIVLLSSNNMNLNIALYSILILVTIILFFTSSRTSIISNLIVILVYYFSKSKTSNEKPLNKILKIFIYLLIIISLVIIFKDLFNRLFGLLGKKFNIYSNDITNGRMEIWLHTIKNRTILGYGHSYFLDTFGLNAHNNFISILGTNGLLSFLVYAYFWICIILRNIKLCKYRKQTCYYQIFLIFLAFHIHGFFETTFSVIGLPIQFVAFSCIGFLLNNNYSDKGLIK